MNSPDLARFCIHTITTRPLPLAEAVSAYRDVGVAGITVWRDALQPQGVAESRRIIADAGLKVVSLCRGGFFPAAHQTDRRKAIDENRRIIDEAADLGAPLIVLVCGAMPGIALTEARKQITDALAELAPHATRAGVRLGIEPLHPMYADTRSAVNTLGQANDMVDAIGSDFLGVTIDVYHLWWDDRLNAEIERAGRRKSIFSFHVCDWLSPTKEMLNDRGLMGDGCIPIREIRQKVEAAGFNGFIEVEIFSTALWATDQYEYLKQIRQRWMENS